MKRMIGSLLTIALALAACGGGEDVAAESTTTVEEQAEDAQPESTEPESTVSETTTTIAKEEPAASAGAEGTGTATIGDTTLQFSIEGGGTCMLQEDSPLFLIIMFGTDGSGRPVTMNISGQTAGGFELVQVGSQNLEFERWTADSSVYDKLSGNHGMPEGVGATIQIDGNTVSGSGVFYDDKTLNDVLFTENSYDAGVLEGTFSATCPNED